MMKICALVIALTAVEAFVVVPNTARTSIALNAKSQAIPFLDAPPALDGSMAGDVGFDPLGLSGITGIGADLYWMREAELKHARVAMLAVTGALFVEGCGSFPGWPEGYGMSQTDVFWDVWADKPNAIVAAITFFTVFEMISGVATTAGRENGLREPGDFMFNPLQFKITDEIRQKEILNGRLAMIAAAGIIVQGMTTHNGALHNLFLGE